MFPEAVVIGLSVGIVLFFIAGGLLGFFIARKMVQKQLKDNPPITEAQIRAMYMKMGRKPTESQVRGIMREFKSANSSRNKK